MLHFAAHIGTQIDDVLRAIYGDILALALILAPAARGHGSTNGKKPSGECGSPFEAPELPVDHQEDVLDGVAHVVTRYAQPQQRAPNEVGVGGVEDFEFLRHWALRALGGFG